MLKRIESNGARAIIHLFLPQSSSASVVTRWCGGVFLWVVRWATYNCLLDKLRAADGVADERLRRVLINAQMGARRLDIRIQLMLGSARASATGGAPISLLPCPGR